MSTPYISGNSIIISGTTNLPTTTGTNGQVFVWDANTNTWVAQTPPTVIWSGSIIGGYGGGGGGQVITSAPVFQQQGQIQLDLPIECNPPSEKKADGATCKKCDEFNEFACPNQDDDTFLCYRCRHNL